jgi:hypothetical protein
MHHGSELEEFEGFSSLATASLAVKNVAACASNGKADEQKEGEKEN